MLVLSEAALQNLTKKSKLLAAYIFTLQKIAFCSGIGPLSSRTRKTRSEVPAYRSTNNVGRDKIPAEFFLSGSGGWKEGTSCRNLWPGTTTGESDWRETSHRTWFELKGLDFFDQILGVLLPCGDSSQLLGRHWCLSDMYWWGWVCFTWVLSRCR